MKLHVVLECDRSEPWRVVVVAEEEEEEEVVVVVAAVVVFVVVMKLPMIPKPLPSLKNSSCASKTSRVSWLL